MLTLIALLLGPNPDTALKLIFNDPNRPPVVVGDTSTPGGHRHRAETIRTCFGQLRGTPEKPIYFELCVDVPLIPEGP